MVERFSQAVIERLGFYVYRIEDPRSDRIEDPRYRRVFYVGKGQGNRALQHARDALDVRLPHAKLGIIRSIRASGLEPRIIIHRFGLDEATALQVEAALIDAYGLEDLTNAVRGHGAAQGPMTVAEVVETYDAPRAKIPAPAVIIKIEQEWARDLSAEQLYERTRRYWVMNPEARSRPPTHALAVARGIIRAVYRIASWTEYTCYTADRDSTRLGGRKVWKKGQLRRGFVGEPDPALFYLIGCSVRHLAKARGENPICYVNC